MQQCISSTVEIMDIMDVTVTAVMETITDAKDHRHE
jgi:hypothetical protein